MAVALAQAQKGQQLLGAQLYGVGAGQLAEREVVAGAEGGQVAPPGRRGGAVIIRLRQAQQGHRVQAAPAWIGHQRLAAARLRPAAQGVVIHAQGEGAVGHQRRRLGRQHLLQPVVSLIGREQQQPLAGEGGQPLQGPQRRGGEQQPGLLQLRQLALILRQQPIQAGLGEGGGGQRLAAMVEL